MTLPMNFQIQTIKEAKQQKENDLSRKKNKKAKSDYYKKNVHLRVLGRFEISQQQVGLNLW